MLNLLADSLLEALEDSAKMLPLLYIACLLIEYIERRQGERIEALLAGGGRWGFLAGAALGCVPQCGFSAVAADLYASRVISLGTLMAVFLATSDEAIPLLAAMPDRWREMLVLLMCKAVYALAVGGALDLIFGRFLPRSLRGGYTGSAAEVDCHEEHEAEEEDSIWLAALRHAAEIFAFVLLFSFFISLIIGWIGFDAFSGFLGRLGPIQPLAAALVGLIPNCAASVLLTQLYLEGALRFSSLVAGLCTGAGVGLAVLWRANPSKKQNLFILGLLLAAGCAAGLLLQLAAWLF